MKSHFWVGAFKSSKQLSEYFEEQYLEDETAFISNFGRDQKTTFYDHDFLEKGFNDSSINFSQKFLGYSYFDLWIKKVEKRMKEKSLIEINTVVFINSEEIDNPVSCKGLNYYLEYLGEIEY